MILLVEDQDNFAKTLREYLTLQGYPCAWAADAQKARALFDRHKPSVVLMDIGLPDGNGLDLARSFMRERPRTAILFLSALNAPEIRLEGLESGALDYITKPFTLKELLLRLKRIKKSDPREIEHGPLKIWFSRYELQDAFGRVHALGQKPMGILNALYQNRGQVVPREDLIQSIWGRDKFPSNRTVDNYIVSLRKWCETDPQKSLQIQSVRGVGYKLTVKEPRGPL